MAEAVSIPHRFKFQGYRAEILKHWRVINRISEDRWLCRCVGGTEKEVTTKQIENALIGTCGCKGRIFHGWKGTGEYRSWQAMQTRCHNPNSQDYKEYGARGIKVCDRWRESFVAFIEDMGPKPHPSCTIDRIDGAGDYCPENCRWQTPKGQRKNTSRIHKITFNGETLLLTEWAERLGISVQTLSARLNTHGWSLERALTSRRYGRWRPLGI